MKNVRMYMTGRRRKQVEPSCSVGRDRHFFNFAGYGRISYRCGDFLTLGLRYFFELCDFFSQIPFCRIFTKFRDKQAS